MKNIIKIISAILALFLVSSALSSFAFANDERMYELSIPANNGNVEVRVDGAVKHNGGGSCIVNIPSGANVTVTATATERSGEFLFWTDGNKNTCAETASYSFKMTGPKELRVWFGAAEGTRIIYRNDNTTRQVLGGTTCLVPEHFNNHLASYAYKLGYTFIGWSLSVAQIKEKISKGEALVVVTPIYESAELVAKISVTGGTIVGKTGTSVDVPVLDKITLKADDAPEGKRFIGWQLSGGIYASESPVLNVVVATDETYTAVFADVGSSESATAGVSLKITNDADGTLRLWSSHFVPKTCEMISYGFIYVKNESIAEEYMTLDLVEERGLSVAEYMRTDKSGVLTCTVDADSVCVRAFVIYADASGNTRTIYSSSMTK